MNNFDVFLNSVNSNSDHLVFILKTDGCVRLDFLQDKNQTPEDTVRQKIFINMITDSINADGFRRLNWIGSNYNNIDNVLKGKILYKTAIFDNKPKYSLKTNSDLLALGEENDSHIFKSFLYNSKNSDYKFSYKMFKTAKIVEQIKLLKIIEEFLISSSDKNGVIDLKNLDIINFFKNKDENRLLEQIYYVYCTFHPQDSSLQRKKTRAMKAIKEEYHQQLKFQTSFNIIKFLKEILIISNMIIHTRYDEIIDKMKKFNLNFNSFVTTSEGTDVSLSIFSFLDLFRSLIIRKPNIAKEILKDSLDNEDDIYTITRILRNIPKQTKKQIHTIDSLKSQAARMIKKKLFNDGTLDVFKNTSIACIIVPIADRNNLINDFAKMYSKSLEILCKFSKDLKINRILQIDRLYDITYRSKKSVKKYFPEFFFNSEIASLISSVLYVNFENMPWFKSERPEKSDINTGSILSNNRPETKWFFLDDAFFKSLSGPNAQLMSQIYEGFRKNVLESLLNNDYFDLKDDCSRGVNTVNMVRSRYFPEFRVKSSAKLRDIDYFAGYLVNMESEERFKNHSNALFKTLEEDVISQNSDSNTLEELRYKQVMSFENSNFINYTVDRFNASNRGNKIQMSSNIIEIILTFTFPNGDLFKFFFENYKPVNTYDRYVNSPIIYDEYGNYFIKNSFKDFAFAMIVNKVAQRSFDISMQRQNKITNLPSKVKIVHNIINNKDIDSIMYLPDIKSILETLRLVKTWDIKKIVNALKFDYVIDKNMDKKLRIFCLILSTLFLIMNFLYLKK